MRIGDLVGDKLGAQLISRWQIIRCSKYSRTSYSRIRGQSNGVFFGIHMFLGDFSSGLVRLAVRFFEYYAYLSFIFGSTSSKSLKPIPQGLPGVASNINRPNSGWKMGRVVPLQKSAISNQQTPQAFDIPNIL